MISPRTSEVYRTTTGIKFRGTFSEPQSTFSDDESRARRVLHVEFNAPLTTGDVVKAHGEQYLLFEHSRAGFQKRLLAYQITHHVLWAGKEEVINPVTRMKEGSSPVTKEVSFPIAMEPVAIKDEVDLERVKYRLRCPSGPEVNDTLGDLTIHTIKKIDGALVVEAF